MPAAPWARTTRAPAGGTTARAGQRDLLGHEAADRETEQVGLADLHRGQERQGIARHLPDVVRGDAGGAADADAGVVEGDNPPGAGERVDQRGIPVVEIPAEMLEQYQPHRIRMAPPRCRDGRSRRRWPR
jgi:hypothetical protein